MSSTCESLQVEIVGLKALILNIKSLSESQVRAIVQQELHPKIVEIEYKLLGVEQTATAATNTANTATVTANKASADATNAFLEIARNTERLRLAEIEAKGASATATRAERNAAEYARQMQLEQQKVRQLEGETARLGRENKALELSDQELRDLEVKNRREAERLAQQDRKNSGKIQEIESEIPPIRSNTDAAKTEAATARRTATSAAEAAELSKGLAVQAKNLSTEATAKATNAISEAARASNSALNTANEVTGVKGILRGVGEKVDGFGRAIGKIESEVGKAVTGAAKAIGISSEALGATARLGGKVLEIFNVVGTVFAILDGMATRELLGARIEAVEGQIAAVGNDVSGVLGRIFQLGNRVNSIDANVGAVRVLANEAKGLSGSATALAQSAQVTGNNAQTTAGTALSTAKQAQTAADGAVRNASRANDNATIAHTEAKQAQGLADKASQSARAANDTATVARTEAKQSTSTAEKAKTAAGEALKKAGEAVTKVVEIGGTVLTIYAIVRSLRLLRGLPGKDGINGKDGITTIIRLPGTKGDKGDRGLSGIGIPGRNGTNGIDGKDGKDVSPAEAANLRALIIAQHNQTRLNSVVQHGATRTTILTPILAAFAPVMVFLKQILDLLQKAGDAAQLALLTIINNKLGNQVIGGISGLVTRIAENTYVEKALSVLTFAATIHNALMLSNNLAQTLGTIIDQVLGFVLPKGFDGNPISINNVIGKAVHEIIADTIGEANYKQITEEWAMANRIYQASANVFNQISNVVGLVTAGMEVIGGNVAKIGNGLKLWGVIGEKAYSWMNPQPSFKGKFFNFINTASEKANTIAMIVAIPIGITQAAIGVNDAIASLKKDLNQEDPKDEHGNPLTDKLGNPLKWEPGITVPDPIKTVAAQEQAKADSKNIIEATLEYIFNGSD